MSDIREILANHDSLCESQDKACGDCRRLQQAILDWHKADLERVIGQDESDPSNEMDLHGAVREVEPYDIEERNKLRAEQRKRADLN